MILKGDSFDEAYPSFRDMTSMETDDGPANLNLDVSQDVKPRASLKRKPEKSRIVRVTADNRDTLTCSYCTFETSSPEDLELHIRNCSHLRNSTHSPIKTTEDQSSEMMSPGRESTPFLSPTSDAQAPEGYLSESENPLKTVQQTALENIIKAQMSLSKITSNFSENKETTKEGPYAFLQQQLLHFQLIQLLQAQLSVDGHKKRPEKSESPSIPCFDQAREKSPPLLKNHEEPKWDNSKEGRKSPSSPRNNVSSMIIQHDESPPPSTGLNTLQMLQRTADEVLTNASKGLLANRLIDSVGDADNKDPELRHRCRYCGKVFSSDSALQIHIRSHTGERPFKCNICGNRFTTRGNLKVHFQRHSDRFPHIKMNCNPVPEHLDKFYPPLLQHMGEIGENGNRSDEQSSPFSLLSHSGPPSFLKNNNESDLLRAVNAERLRETFLRRPDGDSNLFDFKLLPPFGLPSQFKDLASRPSAESDDERETGQSSYSRDDPTEAEREKRSPERMDIGSPEPPKAFSKKHSIDSLLLPSKEHHEEDGKSEISYRMNDDTIHPEREELSEKPHLDSKEPIDNPEQSDFERKEYGFCKEEPIDKDVIDRTSQDDMESYMSDSNGGPNEAGTKSPMSSPIQFSHFPLFGMQGSPKLSMLQGMQMPPLPPSPTNSHNMMMPPSLDPAKVPDIYANLLPRPGSNDNAWEALIEVESSDEKQKVERLMGKSRQKPTEPNQCGICFRVLSCKSALHMHYRIHTGERPFKCRICGRAFTTKGNLKTHMSVHRAKPPMRMFHQCTVCHKRFSNALILQQHIRLHTGEPTDLSPEQIAASEIRDFPMDIPMPLGFPPFSPNTMSSPFPNPPHFNPLLLPFPFNMGVRPPKRSSQEPKLGNSFSSSPRSSSEGSSDHQSPEDLSMKVREEENCNDMSSSRSVISPTSSDYSDAEEKLSLPKTMQTPVSNILFSNTDTVQPSTTSHLNSISPHISGDSGMKNMFSPFFPPLGLLSPFKANLDVGMQNLSDPVSPRMGNTTCKICFKVFACQSALEIHYRSHTKERPFKCPVCDRGFSTKGNMRQHWMTHKSKDETSSEDRKKSNSPSSRMLSSVQRKCPDHPDVTAQADGTSSADTSDEKNELGMKRDREDGITPPEPKRPVGDTDDLGRIGPFPASSPSILPLPASMNIPSSISHHPFSSASRLSNLPLLFPPAMRSRDSLHLA